MHNLGSPARTHILALLMILPLACARTPADSETRGIDSTSKQAPCSVTKKDILAEFKGRPSYSYSNPLYPSIIRYDEVTEDRDELRNWIDAASAAVQKKCKGSTFNILAYFHKKGDNPSTHGLLGKIFSEMVTEVSQAYYNGRIVKTYVHIFGKGHFTWPGPSGSNHWQYNDYSDHGLTRRDGTTVFFSPIR